jgi:hypothetical protein
MVFGSLFRGVSKASGKKIIVAFAGQTGAAECIAWPSADAHCRRNAQPGMTVEFASK